MDSMNFSFVISKVMGFGLSFRIDGFRLVYAVITSVMWLCSTFISPEYFKEHSDGLRRYYIFSAITYFATMGVFLSSDMITTFCFFEIMSLASYCLVVHSENKPALRAGGTYLAIAVIGGLVMLMGIMMIYDMTGTLDYSKLSILRDILASEDNPNVIKVYVAGILILTGFGAKAGMFPLHIWLPKAHPVAPAPASALLSGVLTKSGIFGILILVLEIFKDEPDFGLIIYILGLITMLTGAVLALFSIDLKRTLACSSVSQIGFILTGIGLIPMLSEECTLALSGAVLYMVNHSMFKLCLFLAAGALYMKLHTLDLNELKGAGKDFRFLKVLFLIGALGISGVPLFSGYISKTLIHEGIVEYIAVCSSGRIFFKISEWIFLLSGGMTAAYMTKLFVCIFVEKPGAVTARPHDRHISILSYIAISVPAAVIIFFGVYPKLFINKLACLMTGFNTYSFNEEQVLHLSELRIFSPENLKGSLISLSIGAAIYILFIRKCLIHKGSENEIIYLDLWPKRFDIEDRIYRPLLLKLLPGFFLFVFRYLIKAVNIVYYSLPRIGIKIFSFIGDVILKYIWFFIVMIGKGVAFVTSEFVTWIILILRRTVFSENTPKDNRMLIALKDKYTEREAKDRTIASTISFGVLLISIGLCFTIFYLLLLHFS